MQSFSEMRCNNCGWNNPEGAKVCEKCSEPILYVSVPVKREPIESSQDMLSDVDSPAKVEIVNCPKCGYPVKSEDMYCPNCGAVVNRHPSGSDNDIVNRQTCIMARESVESAKTAESVETVHSDQARVTPPSQSTFGKATVREGFATRENVVENYKGTEVKSGKSTVREIPEEMLDVQAPSETADEPTVPDSSDGFKLVPVDFISGSDTIEFKGDKIYLKRSNIAPGNMAVSEEPAHAEVAFEDGNWYIRDMSGKNATFVVAKNRIKIESGDEIIIGNKKFIFSE